MGAVIAFVFSAFLIYYGILAAEIIILQVVYFLQHGRFCELPPSRRNRKV